MLEDFFERCRIPLVPPGSLPQKHLAKEIKQDFPGLKLRGPEGAISSCFLTFGSSLFYPLRELRRDEPNEEVFTCLRHLACERCSRKTFLPIIPPLSELVRCRMSGEHAVVSLEPTRDVWVRANGIL
jgi:hypothetical protein